MSAKKISYASKAKGSKFYASEANEIRDVANDHANIIDALSATCSGKADKTETYSKTEVDAKIVDADSVFSAHDKAPSGYAVDAVYSRKAETYSKTEVDAAIGKKSNVVVHDSDCFALGVDGTDYLVVANAFPGGGAVQRTAKSWLQSDQDLAMKQNVISDLDAIRSGASAGATAYQLPAGGIPSVDLSTAVQASLGKADTALQAHQDISGKADKTDVAALVAHFAARIAELEAKIAASNTIIEGYMRVSGSSDPALSYKHYGSDMGGSVFGIFYPCLVGTKLTGGDEQVGRILHVLQKLGAATVDGSAMWLDVDGVAHAIDGSEGDVMVCNIETYYRLMGHYAIEGVVYDVFLASRAPFVFSGYAAERVGRRGVSPDYTVAHKDADGVTRMHSAFNPEWAGSYTAPAGVVGKFVYEQQADGSIGETYDAGATLMGGAGGLHSTNLSLPTGEQYAMNQNPDPTQTVPFMNQTGGSVEDWYALLLAEGGTFDAHKASLMGSGFSSNDAATSASDWAESASGAKNGVRIYDKDGSAKHYSPAGDAATSIGLTGSSDKLFGTIANSYRNPFHVMEAQRAVCHGVRTGVGELVWFAFEGNLYKYRSVDGFAGPQVGEMTCVVWKMMSAKLGSGCFDPGDKSTSIEGNRVDLMFSVALWHGITTQASPSWWLSGVVFTEDEAGAYECYAERDQSRLLVTPSGERATSETWAFEEAYVHAASLAKGSGYRTDYNDASLLLPAGDGAKAGGGLHTYVGAYNNYAGSNASAGKKAVRGCRRGSHVNGAYLSPLCVAAGGAPSSTHAAFGFGTCVRIADES